MFHHSARYIDAYRQTIYIIEEQGHRTRFVPDRRSAALDRLLARQHVFGAAYLSAFNPESRPTPPARNRRAQIRLISMTARLGCSVLHGIGIAKDRRWRERGILVYPLARRRAAWIGRIFRQNAFVQCRSGRPPVIVPLR
ncbi:MAG: DUF3293 domain-containing protein [Gemmatimonas sp.]